jgi:hypothetical protein
MKILLRLKHWQLFILLIAMPIVMDLIFIGTNIFSNNDPSPLATILLIVIIFSLCLFFAWFYALGTNLHKKLPESAEMNLTKFKIFLLVPFVFILLICLFMVFMVNNSITGEEPPTIGLWILAILIPIDLFSIFCIFYCLYFNAKALKAVEMQRPVEFSDYVGEFFSLLFFPIGIWIIQPKINKLFAIKNKSIDS